MWRGIDTVVDFAAPSSVLLPVTLRSRTRLLLSRLLRRLSYGLLLLSCQLLVFLPPSRPHSLQSIVLLIPDSL